METLKKIIELIDKYWKFDEFQGHASTWHDKQDLLNELSSLRTEVEQSPAVLSPEEILSQLTDIPVYRIKADDKGEYITKSGAIKAMKAYHSQFEKRVTDEMIEKWAEGYAPIDPNHFLNSVALPAFRTGVIEGAKAMRDGKIV